MPRKTIKLMADYHCFPLWDPEAPDNLDPDDLPLSAGLRSRLREWAARYTATLNTDDPARSGFGSREEEARFTQDGAALHEELKRELRDDYWVQYWCEEKGWWFKEPVENEIVFVFSWWQVDSHASALCSSRLRVGDAGKLLATVIMDDGGVGASTSVKVIDEVIDELRRIEDGELESFEWVREAFCATFYCDRAIASILLDEGEGEEVKLGARDMRRVLTEWRAFIQAPPGPHQAEVRCWLQP